MSQYEPVIETLTRVLKGGFTWVDSKLYAIVPEMFEKGTFKNIPDFLFWGKPDAVRPLLNGRT